MFGICWNSISGFASLNVLDRLLSFLRLQTIIVDHPRLDTISNVVYFLVMEVTLIFTISLMVTVSWMGVFFTGVPPAVAVITTFLFLTYIARRWYLGPHDQNYAQRANLMKIRLAKLVASCAATLLCLMIVLALSVESSPGSESRFVQALQSLTQWIWPRQTLPSNHIHIVRNAQSLISTMFLISLECVQITDIISNVKHMTHDTEFRIALNFEAPILLSFFFRLGVGFALFNIINPAQPSRLVKLALVALLLVWVALNVLDSAWCRTDNPTPRTIDAFGYKLLQDVYWYQVDVDVVAHSLMILMYSQWKTATSVMTTDPEPEVIYASNLARVDIFEITSSCGMAGICEHIVFWRSIDPEIILFHRHVPAKKTVQLPIEAFFVLVMAGISLRCMRNFASSTKYSTILTTTLWGELPPPAQYQVSSRERFARENYDRDVAFPFLVNVEELEREPNVVQNIQHDQQVEEQQVEPNQEG